MDLEPEQDEAREGLARLRAAVLADSALAASLIEIWRPDTFAARAAEAARARGVALDARQIAALLAAGPEDAAVETAAPPPGWLPANATERAGELVVDWAFFGARRLTEPFYEESLAAVASLPFNRLIRLSTPLAALTAPAGALAPAGLIFHMSRCGSTLAAQMLAASDANIVVSEGAPVGAVVRLDRAKAGLDEAGHAARLAAVVGAFGRPRGGERRYFVKLDSWHACALPLFRRAFPKTPWVFLYRDPTEVLVSQMRRRGMQMTPQLVSPRFVGIDWEGDAPREDYAARVLAALCDAAISGLVGGGGLLVNYDELPGALSRRILPHFGVQSTPDEINQMDAAARRDAKDPSRPFAPDSAAKQAAASEAVSLAVRRRLAGVFSRLEAARWAGWRGLEAPPPSGDIRCRRDCRT